MSALELPQLSRAAVLENLSFTSHKNTKQRFQTSFSPPHKTTKQENNKQQTANSKQTIIIMHLRLATKLLASIFIASSSVVAAAPSLVRGGKEKEKQLDIVSSDFVFLSCCYTHQPSTPSNTTVNLSNPSHPLQLHTNYINRLNPRIFVVSMGTATAIPPVGTTAMVILLIRLS